MKILLIALSVVIGTGCNVEKEKIVFKESAQNFLNDSTSTPEKYSQVTKEFGALIVREGNFSAESKTIPWSSWWFPAKDKYLFESDNPNELAPLQKYDLYVRKNYGIDPLAASYEETEIYDPAEVNWAGLCHAWAVASVLHPEPKSEITRKGIKFSVADQKALLLKSYENASDLKFFGSRYNGNYNDDFSDVYPDQFHRFVEVFLFEKHLPFLMDYEPSFPVWTVPVFNVKFNITKEDETSAHVKAWVTTASSFVDNPNFVGTKKSVKYYEYKLIGTWQGTELLVTGSEWVNDSIYDHPDYLIAYPDTVKRSSLNKKLEITKVNEILGIKNTPPL